MLPIRTILHPTDFSDNAANAYHLAAALARDYGARLIVIHVAPIPVVGLTLGVVPPPPRADEALLHKSLHEYSGREWVDVSEEIVVEGDPATEILGVAEEENCDLIVMGTHGLTGLERLLMGSVAEQVLRRAPCPVLTVRTPAKVAAGETTPTSAPERTRV